MATVLIVDDEQPIVDLLCELVTDAGHTAMSANNGLDALHLAQQHHPALIISDLMMPVLDGNGLLQALQHDPVLAHTMVILISAAANRSQIPANATAFVAKPLDLDMIEAFLQRLV
jgi:CheY-like chemotaxis protein